MEQYYINATVETLIDDATQITLRYKSLDTQSLELEFIINSQQIFYISQIDTINLIKEIYLFFESYQNNNTNSKIKFDLQDIKFDTTYYKRYDRFLTKIIDKDKKTLLQIDTRDLLVLFSDMFLHLTLVYDLRYDICLQQDAKLSKTKYLKLISVGSRGL